MSHPHGPTVVFLFLLVGPCDYEKKPHSLANNKTKTEHLLKD